jgi:hypothetical protein
MKRRFFSITNTEEEKQLIPLGVNSNKNNPEDTVEDDYFDDDQRVDPRTGKTTVTNNKNMYFEGAITSGNYYRGTGEFVYNDMAGEDYEYKGEIVNGVLHGKGIMKFSGGDLYVGDFYNGVYHGSGMYRQFVDFEDEKGVVHENTYIVFEGTWDQEVLVDGTIRYPDGTEEIVTRELLQKEAQEQARKKAAGEPTPEYDHLSQFSNETEPPSDQKEP